MPRACCTPYRCLTLGLMLVALVGFCPPPDAQGAAPLRVAATVPELGSLVRHIGGDQVEVTVFAKVTEDPHFVEPKPSFIRVLNQVDLYIQVGMDLELGWAPVLLQNAANPKVLPGARGYVDASTVIAPLEIPTGLIDRSRGDVHPAGNPHYLTDPLNGLKVAALLRDKLSELRPEQRRNFGRRYEAFRQRLGVAMVGETLANKYGFEKLTLLYEYGKLGDFLKQQGDEGRLGGWLGMLLPYYGTKVVADHNAWPYFARRFGITIVGFMEPKPGIPPTTKHLGELVNVMRAEHVGIVLEVPYYDPRHAQFIAQNTGATVVNMAHQVGARAGTEDYLDMIDYNVRQLVGALRAAP
ncbi:MAG TPA: metal ABC transporter substrate-binding protein [Alphaproteobacteria bacterium]|nr:metal ABC transporter substrate-binding protein [Alphaproteobacteria bacterium]